jgi:hypothetical protein
MNWHEFSLYLKIGLLVIIAGVGLFKLIAKRETYVKWRVTILVILGICAFLSVGTYIRFGNFLYGHYLHYHDISHYYFAAKYAPEVGYFNLYNSIVIAEAEMAEESGKTELPRKMRERRIRNLRTYDFSRLDDIVTDPGIVNATKSNFSPRRWDEFKQDLKIFYVVQYANILYDRCGDMGYNGSPIWGTFMHLISNAIDISRFNMKALGTLDYLYFLIGFAFIWWAFGAEVALIAITFYFSNMFNHRMFIIGSIMRFDWLCYVLVGLSLVKKQYYKTAAVFFSLAGLIRLFPVFLVFGIGVKFLYDWFTTREKAKQYLGFFITYGMTCILLLGLSAGLFGVDYYKEYFQKLEVHSQTFSSTRAGLPYMLMWEGESRRGDFQRIAGTTDWDKVMAHKRAVLSHRTPLKIVIIASFLALLVLAVRRLEDWEAIAFSYSLIFLLLGMTIYYSVIITLLCILFTSRNNNRPYWISYALLMPIIILHYPIQINVGYGLLQNFIISSSIFMLLLASLLLFVKADPVSTSWLLKLWRKTFGRPRNLAARLVLSSLLFVFFSVFLVWQLYPLGAIAKQPGWQEDVESFLDDNHFDADTDILVITPVSMRNYWVRGGKHRRLMFTNDLSAEPFYQYKRIWVLNMGDQFDPSAYKARPASIGKRLQADAYLNKEPLNLVELIFDQSIQSVYNFREKLLSAKVYMDPPEGVEAFRDCPLVGPRFECSREDWNYVGRVNKMVGHDDRLAIWAHPTFPPLVIEYPEVPIGDFLAIGAGLADNCLGFVEGTHVKLEIFVDDERVTEIITPNQRGWKHHIVDTSAMKEETATVRFKVSAPNISRRHFMWTGDVVVTR